MKSRIIIDMKRGIKLVVIVALLLGVNLAMGQQKQEEGSDRRVEVTREYVPEMERANKLDIVPDMVDTVALRPDFDYTIRPSALRGGFGVRAIHPVRLSAAQYEAQMPFYLKLGGGLPTQSLADLYYVTGNERGNFGFSLNHRGGYSKIKSDLERKEKAANMQNRFETFVEAYISQRLVLDVTLGVEYDTYRNYGKWLPEEVLSNSLLGDDVKYARSFSSPKQRFTMPYGEVSIGNDFRDLSKFNFLVYYGGYMFQDDYKNREGAMDIGFKLGRSFGGVSTFLLDLNYGMIKGEKELDGYKNRIFTATPEYLIKTNKLKLELGAKLLYNKRELVGGKFTIFPLAKVEYLLSEAFAPFAVLDGRLHDNSLMSIMKSNPYVVSQGLKDHFHPTIEPGDANAKPVPTIVNSKEYNLKAGIFGKLGASVNYRVFFGLERINDPLFWIYGSDLGYSGVATITPTPGETSFANIGEGGSPIGSIKNGTTYGFMPLKKSKRTTTTVGIELEAKVSKSVSLLAGFNFYDHSVKGGNREQDGVLATDKLGLPDFDGMFQLRFNHRNKFFLNLTADFIGSREFSEFYMGSRNEISHFESHKQSTVVDLSLDVEYRLSKGFGVFVEGQNLTNSKLYRFNHYRDRGLGVVAGVKLMF